MSQQWKIVGSLYFHFFVSFFFSLLFSYEWQIKIKKSFQIPIKVGDLHLIRDSMTYIIHSVANRRPMACVGTLRAVKLMSTATNPALGTDGMARDTTVVSTLGNTERDKCRKHIQRKSECVREK